MKDLSIEELKRVLRKNLFRFKWRKNQQHRTCDAMIRRYEEENGGSLMRVKPHRFTKSQPD